MGQAPHFPRLPSRTRTIMRWNSPPIHQGLLASYGFTVHPSFGFRKHNSPWCVKVELSCDHANAMKLGAGVIADIATRAERGGFFGVYTLGPMVKSFLEPSPNLSLTLVRSQLGPCIGPIIGGALAQNLGWRRVLVSCHHVWIY